MNLLIYEQIMSLLGLIALWAFWFYLWKPQRADIFRQNLFALRSDLFDLAASGVLPFDHPAYTQLRLMINGMIRFGHRLSVPTLIVALAQSGNAPSDPLAAWRENVQRLPEEARNQLLGIHSSLSRYLAKHLIGGSVLLTTYVLLRVSFAIGMALLTLLRGKGSFSNFTVSHARSRVEREREQVANVIEAGVLQDEQRRTGAKQQHAYAH